MTPIYFFNAMYQANLAMLTQFTVAALESSAAFGARREIAQPEADTGGAGAKQASPLCINASYGSACWIATGGQDSDAANELLQDDKLPRMHRQAA